MNTEQFIDALGLSLLFAASGAVAIFYYRLLPSTEDLRNRLPNKISLAGILLAVVITAGAVYIVQTTSGRATFFGLLALIYHLLIFETLLLVIFRWIKNSLWAVIVALALTVGWAFLVIPSGSSIIYNLTFFLVVLGAPSFLFRQGYLRTKFLFILSGLWSVYDILSTKFIYPTIFREVAEPIPSFRYPSFISGQLTLGLGDIMFLSLFTLALWRDRGPKWAWIHVGIQAVVLLLVAALKPPLVFFPYLVVMTVIFFTVYRFSKYNRQYNKSAGI